MVVDDLAEICDKGPRTHTMNASRERGFVCCFSLSFFSVKFPGLESRISTRGDQDCPARESGGKNRGEGSSQGGRVLFLEACGDLDQRW